MGRLFFLLLSLAIAAASPETGENIFVLAGQSNMAGRGGVAGDHWDGIVPPECRSSPLIFRFDSRLRWQPAREPLHAGIDRNKTVGVGPGMAFAGGIAARRRRTGELGLVPCAVGGTKITDWRRGGELYQSLVRRATAAAAAAGDGGGIRGLLWFQGERDTILKEDAESYQERMEKLIDDLRFDLDFPMLPVIQVALASGEGPYMEKVREAQLGIDLQGVVTVDAKGLPLEEDNLHLTTEAQVKLGKMLAAAYLEHFAIFLPLLSSQGVITVEKSLSSQLFCCRSLAIVLSLGWIWSHLL